MVKMLGKIEHRTRNVQEKTFQNAPKKVVSSKILNLLLALAWRLYQSNSRSCSQLPLFPARSQPPLVKESAQFEQVSHPHATGEENEVL